MAKANRRIGTREERFLRCLEELANPKFNDGWVYDAQLREKLNWSDTSFGKTLEVLKRTGKVKFQGYGGGRMQPVARAPDAPQPLKAFISYSHDDKSYMVDLRRHLAPLERSGAVKSWDDREIPAGADWQKTIKGQLNCDIFIVLVSASFIASQYCYDVELQEAIDRAKKGKLVIIPVVVRACMWERTQLKDIQHATREGTVIATAKDRDEALSHAAREIAKVVERLRPAN